MTFSTPSPAGPDNKTVTVSAFWLKWLLISLTFLVWLVLLILVARLIGYVSTALLILFGPLRSVRSSPRPWLA